MEHRGWKWMVREQDGGMGKDGAMRMVFDGAGVGWRDGKRRCGKTENGMADGRKTDGAADGVCTSAGWSNSNKKIRHFHGQTGADRLLQNKKIFGKINSVA